MINLACKDSEEISQEIIINWVHLSPGLISRDGGRQVGVTEIACAFIGEFLLGDSNVEKWNGIQKKKFFINKCIKALIP